MANLHLDVGCCSCKYMEGKPTNQTAKQRPLCAIIGCTEADSIARTQNKIHHFLKQILRRYQHTFDTEYMET
jgi:hypothetical protein